MRTMNYLSKRDLITFIQLTTLFIILNYNNYFLVPDFESLKVFFGVSDSYLGILSGGYLFANGFSTLAWSYLSETRFRARRKILSLSFILASAFVFIDVFIYIPIYFMALIILSGFALGSVLPLGFSIIADIIRSEERTQAYTLWYTFGGIGISLGIALSAITSAIYGWRFSLVLDSILLLAGGIAALFIEEPIRGKADIETLARVESKVLEFRLRSSDIRVILSNKVNLLLIVEGVLQVIPDTVILIWGFQFIMRELKTCNVAALAYLSIVGTGAFGGILLARLVDRVYSKEKIMRPFMASLFCILSAVFFIFFFSSHFELDVYEKDIVLAFILVLTRILKNPYVLIASLFYFLGKFINTPLGPIKESILADINLPEHRSIIKSFLIIIELISRSVSTLIVGLVSDLMGELRIAIIYMLTPWLLASLFWIIIAKKYVLVQESVRKALRKRLQ